MSALYPPEFRGGATLVCQRLADELGSAGHACVVFAGRATAAEPLGAVARGRIRRCPTFRVNVGGALLPWGRDGYWNPVATRAFEAFLAEVRPDVVHVHSLQGLGAGLIASAREAGVPVVVTMHDWWWHCPCLFRLSPAGTICPADGSLPERCSGVRGLDFEARRTTLGAALAGVARIVVPSAFLRTSLLHCGIGGRRGPEITVHPNGLAPARTAPPPAGEHAGPLRLLFLGGAGNQAKGLEILLAAAARIEGDFVLDAHAVAPEEAAPWAAALGPRLRCHPPFEPDRLDDVMSTADVVVVPSLMRESFSLVAHEARVRGRPVVASDCGGPQEIVRDGENGRVVPSGSVPALADALRHLVADRAAVRRLAASACLVPTSLAEHARRTESLYRDVVREARRRRPAGSRMRLAGRRVLFLTGMDGAPLRYRAWNLVERLARAGILGRVLYHSDVRATAVARVSDLIVLYRAPYSATVDAVVRDARTRGVPVVFSSDDLVFRADDLADAPALEHPDPRVVGGYRQSVEGHARCLAAADAFLGSTPELEGAARDLGLPTYCVPNGVSDRVWALSRDAVARRGAAARAVDRVRMGFASGTDTHDADLEMLAPVLAEVLDRQRHADLTLGGPVKLPAALERFGERIERWPFVAWSDLPEHLAAFDVNLAPLDTRRPFNLAKSEVKLIEAAAVGVPTVASHTPSFRRASREGAIGMLCRSGADWRESLTRLVSETGLRESLGRAARREVESRYGSEGQVDDLVEILAEVFDRGPAPGRPLPAPDVLEAGEGSDVAIEPGAALYDRYQLDAESGGPLRPGAEVEQRFTCRHHGLARVDVRVGTYARRNHHALQLSLRDDRGRTLARRVVRAERLVDRSFVALPLDAPWRESAGREVTLRASASGAREGNEILLWQAPSELGGLRIGGEERTGRALSFRAFALPESGGAA